jgi:LacI family transcriptional regulator
MGTVSHVINHPERVTAKTRAKVERAIEILGYAPSGIARSLATGTTNAVGLILSDLQNSLFVDIARGAERAVDERSSALLLANSDGTLEREQRYLGLFRDTRVLATLVTLNDAFHYRRVVDAASRAMTLILLNYDARDGSHCTVSVDNASGARMAVEHLVETGRRRIALVTLPGELQPIVERERGFNAALADRGLSVAETITVNELSRADGYVAGLRLVPRIEAGEIDGIFAMADLVAAGVAQAILAASSLSIPADVGIVGYDDNRAAWDSPTPLTTIAQPGEAMGYEGVGLAFDEMADPTHTHRSITLSPRLLVRASTVSR